MCTSVQMCKDTCGAQRTPYSIVPQVLSTLFFYLIFSMHVIFSVHVCTCVVLRMCWMPVALHHIILRQDLSLEPRVHQLS